MRAWARRRRLDPDHNPEAWVRTTAYRISVSRWRRATSGLRAHRRHGPAPDLPGADEPAPSATPSCGAAADQPAAAPGDRAALPLRPAGRPDRLGDRRSRLHRQDQAVPRTAGARAAARAGHGLRGSPPCLSTAPCRPIRAGTGRTGCAPACTTSRPPGAGAPGPDPPAAPTCAAAPRSTAASALAAVVVAGGTVLALDRPGTSAPVAPTTTEPHGHRGTDAEHARPRPPRRRGRRPRPVVVVPTTIPDGFLLPHEGETSQDPDVTDWISAEAPSLSACDHPGHPRPRRRDPPTTA